MSWNPPPYAARAPALRHQHVCLQAPSKGRRRQGMPGGRSTLAGTHALDHATLSVPQHRSSVWGLRLQHWNKTQHYFIFSFCLFIHLSVYLELHFVKNLPFSFYSPVN